MYHMYFVIDERHKSSHLFSLVILIKSFDKYSVPLDNIICFGSHGCNTMMGWGNSLSSQFREKCPGISINNKVHMPFITFVAQAMSPNNYHLTLKS